MCVGVSLHAVKRLSTIIAESVLKLDESFRCIALVVMQVKRTPQCFSRLRPILTVIGPK